MTIGTTTARSFFKNNLIRLVVGISMVVTFTIGVAFSSTFGLSLGGMLYPMPLGIVVIQKASAAPSLISNTWTVLNPTGDANATPNPMNVYEGTCSGGGSLLPCSRNWAGATYNPARQKFAVYGGGVIGGSCAGGPYNCGYQNDLWEYDFPTNKWTQYDPTQRGLAWELGTDNVSMGYEAVSGRMYALGFTGRSPGRQFGYYDYATKAMIEVTASGQPGASQDNVVYDAAFACGDGKCVAFSGQPSYYSNPGQRTSIFDPAANGGAGSWTSYQSTCTGSQPVSSCSYNGQPTPTPRMQCQHCMVFDSDRHKFILFGGSNQTADSVVNDTWEYDLPTNRWTRIMTAHSPIAREKHMMVYMPAHRKVLLYGGQGFTSASTNSAGVFKDTWLYDPVAQDWTQLPTNANDPYLSLSTVSYDAVNDVVLMFSGSSDGGGSDSNSNTYAFRYQSAAGSSDTTAPSTPANLSATALSETQVNLSWNSSTDDTGVSGYTVYRCTGTCVPASQIGVSASTSYQDAAVLANTAYTYAVSAYDAAGNSSSNSAVVNVTTPVAPADTVPPTVSITAPSNGATVSGATAVNVTASDAVGVVGVQFKLDGANLGAEDTTSPYATTWDTTAATNGIHSLTALARDAAGNTATASSVTVTVNNQTAAVPSGYYQTSFDATENPISESGAWANGQTDGLDWHNVQTMSGRAVGTLATTGYDDPTAVLKGTWSADQYAQGTVFSQNATNAYSQEVELRLRSSVTAHRSTGYEIFFRTPKSSSSYAQIVRWNGSLGDFTSLAVNSGTAYGVTNGDVVKATIVGNVITGYINGVAAVTATDAVFTTGNPGIGFNYGVGNTYADFGFSDYVASNYTAPPTGVYTVCASGCAYTTIQSAINAVPDGATITIASGTYTGAGNRFSIHNRNNLTLQVAGGGGNGNYFTVDCQQSSSGDGSGKACVYIDVSSGITMDGIKVYNFGSAYPSNGALRVDSMTGDFTIRNSYILHSQWNGIIAGVPGNYTAAGAAINPNPNKWHYNFTVENTRFEDCAYGGDGQEHAIYVSAWGTLAVRRSLFLNNGMGHNIKSRAATTIVEYNKVVSGLSSSGHSSINALSLSCGGVAYVIGNVFQQSGPISPENSIDVIRMNKASDLVDCPGGSADTAENKAIYPNHGWKVPTQQYFIHNTVISDRTTSYGSIFNSDVAANWDDGAPSANTLFVSKNNIFYLPGSNTSAWLVSRVQNTYFNSTDKAPVETNDLIVRLTDPGWVNKAGFDYHLSAGATTAIDQGVAPGVSASGYDLTPRYQYVETASQIARSVSGAALDLGAFEYDSGATPPADSASPTGVGNSLPANGATNVSLTPLLTANIASDATTPVSYYFELYQGSTCTGTPIQTREYSTATTWTPAALAQNAVYSWHNKARDSAAALNESSFGGCYYFTTLVSLPASPSLLIATTASVTQINLSWADNSNNEDGFKIERKIATGSFAEIAFVAANVTTYQSTSLAPATAYTYRVRAYNAAGDTTYANEASATTLADTQAPSTPTNVAATTQADTQINISWVASTDNVGVTGYQVARSTASGGPYTPITTTANTTYPDTGLAPSTSYYYIVKAIDASGNLSASSVEVTAMTTPFVPPADTTPPTVSITAPVNAATISGVVSLTATASDNDIVVGVQFNLDGQALGSEDLTAPYQLSWNTTAVSNGAHVLTALARDAASNSTTSSSVTVTVANQAPATGGVSLGGGLASGGGGGGGAGAGAIQCTENWTCTVWTNCANGTQSRLCVDSNQCGTTTTRPAVSQTCVMPGTSTGQNPSSPSYTPPSGSLADLIRSVLARERARFKALNVALRNRLLGWILLQVEEKGEAWYLEPITKLRYYLANGDYAYQALRRFGLGITDKDLNQIPVGLSTCFQGTDTDADGIPDKMEEGLGTDPLIADSDQDGFKDGEEVLNGYTPLGSGKMANNSALVNRLKGRILLQVQKNGQAWYLNPKDGKRYYTQNGEAAYQIMRCLSLGIQNKDLNGLPVGE